MIVDFPPKRYKIELVVDTHLSREQIWDLLRCFGCYQMKVQDEEGGQN